MFKIVLYLSIICLFAMILQLTHFATSVMHFPCKTFFFSNSQVGWIAGDDGLFKTSDGGKTWTSLTRYLQKPESNNFYKLNDAFFINDRVGWVVAKYGHILKTVDGGLSWHVQTPSLILTLSEGSVLEGLVRFSKVQFLDQNHGWVLGSILRSDDDFDVKLPFILRTADGGLSWIKIDLELKKAAGLQTFQFLTRNQGWLVHFHNIYRTDDGGDKWISLLNSPRSILRDLTFTDSLNGWAITDDGKIFSTYNGGKDWSAQEFGRNYGMRKIFFTDRTYGWITGNMNRLDLASESILLATKDGGLTWSIQYREPERSVILYPFFISPQEGWLLVNRLGLQHKDREFKILHTSDGGQTWVPLYGNQPPKQKP